MTASRKPAKYLLKIYHMSHPAGMERSGKYKSKLYFVSDLFNISLVKDTP